MRWQITIILYENQAYKHRKAELWKKDVSIGGIKGKNISSRHSNCWRMKTILLNRKSMATFVHKMTYITSCHWNLNLNDTWHVCPFQFSFLVYFCVKKWQVLHNTLSDTMKTFDCIRLFSCVQKGSVPIWKKELYLK